MLNYLPWNLKFNWNNLEYTKIEAIKLVKKFPLFFFETKANFKNSK